MLISPTIREEEPKDKPFAILGGGCFWCVESEFRRLEGVLFTQSGYEGGSTSNPTYQDVCTGKTGHAEVTKIYFDPTILPFHDLLIHFLTVAHDPTEVNRQGVDIGTQYRSVIFYADDDQKQIAQKTIYDVQNSGRWKKPIATTLEPHTQFWPAEAYHQRYYEKFEEHNGVLHPNAFLKMRKWGAI